MAEMSHEAKMSYLNSGYKALQNAKSEIMNRFPEDADTPASAIEPALMGYQEALELVDNLKAENMRLKRRCNRFRFLIDHVYKRGDC